MGEPKATEGLVRLIYRSHSKLPSQDFENQLGDILRVARRNNSAKGVTGALMYYDGWFAQALEGPEEAVHAIFAKIKADARHNSIELKSDGSVQGRVFARWAMANVGEHGDRDTPLVAHGDGVTAAADWKTTPEQESVLTILRDSTRGYGRGA